MAGDQRLLRATTLSMRGGTFDISGFSQSIATLNGTGTIAFSSAASGGTLGVGSGIFGGALIDGASHGGALIKEGPDTLTLNGTSTVSGPTTVLGGALIVNGGLANSTVRIASGVLGGAGTVGAIAVLLGGAVAPGNGIGTLNVAGNVGFAVGSVYQAEANAAGLSDRIAATGSAILQGGTVQVLAQAGAYNPRTRYTILTAGGGVSGQFAGATSNMAFLTPVLRYQASEVDLTLTRNDITFSTVATTRNAASVADAIQAGGPGTRAYDSTVGLSAPEAQGAFRQLSGGIHGSTVSSAYETAFFVREAILDRLRWGTTPGASDGLDYGSLPAAYTADLPGRRPVVASLPVRTLDPTVIGVWGQVFGAFGSAGGGNNAFSVNRQLAGFAAGIDVRLPSGIRLGLVGGYSEAYLDTTGHLDSATIKSGFGGAYGGYAVGPVSLRLGATYADNDIRSRRTITIPGFTDAPTAHDGGHTVQGFGEIGYRFFVGQPAPVALVSKDGTNLAPVQPVAAYIEPFVGGAYVGIRRGGFTETGGAAALTSFARDYDLGALTAGIRGQSALDLGLGVPISAHALLGYRRAFGDVLPKALLAFGSGPAFLSSGVPIDRDALVAEAGVDVRVAPNATLGVAYTGQTGSRAQDQAVKGNFIYRF
ncbi:autotransporter outer membrane beta-barrel domain-containing protein [Methylobacterium planeticum]|uniref:Autotransporter domain-containing protein n=1 Tax=Methylobacterium planeticum TaxID=2615211 RepID=A0A6N6MHV7_9HYPH|nr:autotransporter domain-containing protein [Methylobacterium planeticum]KAB1069479.1 autotransporter domain-containing protein [Methylobacterium planeticum]